MNCKKSNLLTSLFVFIVIHCLVTVVAAQTITVTSNVDRNRVMVFERINYTVKVESDSRRVPDPIPPEFTGFRLIGAPRTSSQFSWVNGQISNIRTFIYTLEAREPGEHIIQSARVETRDGVIRSAPVSVTVLSPGDSSDRETSSHQHSGMSGIRDRGNLFLEVVTDNDNPFTGEAVRVSWYVYTRVNIRDYGIQEEPEYHGFWVEQVLQPRQVQMQTRNMDGVEYGEAKIHEVIVYPTVSGELIIPPLVMAFQIQDRQRDPFDQFFSSPFQSGMFGTRQVTVSSRPKALNVRSLPETGQPSDFSGGVGEFHLDASINTDRVTAGEAIIVSVTLSGNHGLQTISAPRAPSIQSFRVFDPKPGEITQSTKFSGWKSRTFDYVFVPLTAGEFQLPGITFSYFNTATESYQILKTELFNVIVDAAPGDMFRIATRNNGRELRLMNVDIRYIKTGSGITHYIPAYKTVWFAAFLLMPILVAPVVLLTDYRKRRLEGDSLLAREIRAKSAAAKRFLIARKACFNQDTDCALDTIAQAFALYLADRLGLPEGGITLRRVIDAMNAKQIDSSIVNQVKDYWETVESARYSPIKPTLETVETLTDTGQKLVVKLEKVKFAKSGKTLSANGKKQ